jgi:hypothetical protein
LLESQNVKSEVLIVQLKKLKLDPFKLEAPFLTFLIKSNQIKF